MKLVRVIRSILQEPKRRLTLSFTFICEAVVASKLDLRSFVPCLKLQALLCRNTVHVKVVSLRYGTNTIFARKSIEGVRKNPSTTRVSIPKSNGRSAKPLGINDWVFKKRQFNPETVSIFNREPSGKLSGKWFCASREGEIKKLS